MMFKSGKRALTLSETLVVVAILGLLASLLLPAVQSARESSRRTVCEVRLRQLATAALNYEAVHRVVVPGSIGGSGEANRASAFVMLLPYLEMKATYDQLNFSLRMSSVANTTACLIGTPHFLCPSTLSPMQPALDLTSKNPSLQAPGSYCGNLGSGEWGRYHNGVIVPASKRVRMSDIVDGAATTAMFSEWVTPTLRTSGGTLTYSSRSTMPGLIWKLREQFKSRREFTLKCFGSSGTNDGGFLGVQWFSGSPGDSRYNHQMPPNRRSCVIRNPNPPVSIDESAITAGSMHPGGVNIVFVDGSTKFLADSIDLEVWRAISTKNGGETIPAF